MSRCAAKRCGLLLQAIQACEPVTDRIVDDTGLPKQENKSLGVQRQYRGTLGKTAHCQIGVSVTLATRTMHLPVDTDWYLPQSWVDDRARGRAAHIPDEVGYRPMSARPRAGPSSSIISWRSPMVSESSPACLFGQGKACLGPELLAPKPPLRAASPAWAARPRSARPARSPPRASCRAPRISCSPHPSWPPCTPCGGLDRPRPPWGLCGGLP